MTTLRPEQTLRLHVNGSAREVAPGTTLAALVGAQVGRGAAVARNGEVVARDAWSTTRLADGDIIEIVRAVQGG